MQQCGGKGKENKQMLLLCISAEPSSIFSGWQARVGGVQLGDLELLCVLPQLRGAMASQAPAK